MSTPLWAIKGINKVFTSLKSSKQGLKKAKFKVTQKYKTLSGTKRAAIEGFGTGLKYGTFGVGALVVGKGAYDIATGKNKKKNKKKGS